MTITYEWITSQMSLKVSKCFYSMKIILTYNVWILFNGENVLLTKVLSLLSYNDNKLNFSKPRNVSPRTHTNLFAFSNLCVKKSKKNNNDFDFLRKCVHNKSMQVYNKQLNLSLLTRVADAWIRDEIHQMVNAQADCLIVYYIHHQ